MYSDSIIQQGKSNIEISIKNMILKCLKELDWRATPKEIAMNLEKNNKPRLKSNTIVVYSKSMNLVHYEEGKNLIIADSKSDINSLVS